MNDRFSHRILKRIAGFGVFIALTAALWTAESAQEQRDSSAGGDTPHVRIAFFNKILIETDVKDAKSAIEYWMQLLIERLHASVDGRVYDDLDSLFNDFNNGTIDWMVLSPDDFLKLKGCMDMEFGPIPVMGGKTTRNYLLLSRSESKADGIAGLQGRTLALTKDNVGGRIFMNTLLLQKGMKEMDGYFSELIDKRTYSQAILAVFFQQADACITSDYAFETLAELNPQIRERLHIIASSPTLVHAVSVFGKNVSDEIKNGLTHELLNLQNNPEGNQVMMLLKIEGMVQGKASDIESFKTFIRDYAELKNSRLRTKSTGR